MRFLVLLLISFVSLGQKINRKKLVERHIVRINQVDTLGSLSVGNGHFAFTVDITGLQTFPQVYSKGIPLGTQSNRGWHSFPNLQGFQRTETYRNELYAGRPMSYALQGHKDARKDAVTEYFRQNPHRIHLGHLGFRIYSKRGKLLPIDSIQHIRQTLNPYTGEIHSQFQICNEQVDVVTFADTQADGIHVRVRSRLLQTRQLKFYVDYPFPSEQFLDEGVRYQNGGHQTTASQESNTKVSVTHRLDSLVYRQTIQSNRAIQISKSSPHVFEFSAMPTDEITLASVYDNTEISDFQAARVKNQLAWLGYWSRGGMIDFGRAMDPRARELERRMILSMYLTRIQSAGNEPPQETGLTYNSWYGRPHLEMTWWHLMHFAYWGRGQWMENSLDWYVKNVGEARALARRQGLSGARWQKMTDPSGGESPSSVGSFLLWQQPHLIDMLGLLSKRKSITFKRKYAYLVEETALAMQGLLVFDSTKQVYRLGPGFIPAQESLPFSTTYNAPLELTYWAQGLREAQRWRKDLGKKENPTWTHILTHFPAIPVYEGIYQAAEGLGDGYQNSKYISDHPAVLGALGMLEPLGTTDFKTMRKTMDKVLKSWNWESTWGWDFPLMAMTALRLHDSTLALDLLLYPHVKNSYLVNGHNYQDKRLRLYLPGNGGLLTTLAWMAQGTMGDKRFGGFPKAWRVHVEGF